MPLYLFGSSSQRKDVSCFIFLFQNETSILLLFQSIYMLIIRLFSF